MVTFIIAEDDIGHILYDEYKEVGWLTEGQLNEISAQIQSILYRRFNDTLREAVENVLGTEAMDI
jgi:hypothetical protein